MPHSRASAAAILCFFVVAVAAADCRGQTVAMPLDELKDRIQGGLLGQILGNLNGLPHENKYYAEPGGVESYTPALPEGARTDDDTDIEWMYVLAIEKAGRPLLEPGEVRTLWLFHVNQGIWCANEYSRRLMDLGIEPPLTGRRALNPWSHFNISGQFTAECFGLLAPAMPQEAARIGLHYTHAAIDGEPAQQTQAFTAMIATAFVEKDVEKVLLAGAGAADPASEVAAILRDVHAMWKQSPQDWRALRRNIHKKYATRGGQRDMNGHECNTAAVAGALLAGRGDFVETLRLAFNFGYDADCNAATCGTIMGVIRGRKWMDAQGWDIKDVYKNTTRTGLPKDETITRFGERLTVVARLVLREAGAKERTEGGRTVIDIPRQTPAPVEKLISAEESLAHLRQALVPHLALALNGSKQDQARAAYLALALDEAETLAKAHPDAWARALEALRGHSQLVSLMRKGGPDAAVAARFKAMADSLGPEPPKP